MTPQDRNISRAIERIHNPMSAIRAKCIECMGGHLAEIDRCTARNCPLYAFRNGCNPFHKLSRQYQEEVAPETEEVAV